MLADYDPNWPARFEEVADERDLYARAKRQASEVATGSRDYTAHKTSTVQAIVDRARRARGLPLVDVWDK